MKRLVCKLACITVFGAAGCGLDLPPEYLVEDLRVLDIRVRPPEIQFFEGGGDPLAFDPEEPPPIARTPVEIRALVAHPDLDAIVSFDWFRCRPGLRSVPCDDPERFGDGPQTSFVPVERLLSDVAEGADLQTIGFALAEDPRDLLNGLYGYVNLSARVEAASMPVDTQRLEATKRVVIFEPRLVALALREARNLDPEQVPRLPGVDLPTLCTHLDDNKLEELYGFLASRRPNLAPTYVAATVEIEDAKGVLTSTAALAPGDTIEIEPGGAVVLRADHAETDAEKYALIDANCDLQQFEERLSTSWFTQRGTLSRQLTTKENPTTSWRAPSAEEIPAGSELRVRIWSVLRDGRGGSDHLSVDVVVASRR